MPAHLSRLTHPDAVSRVPQTRAWHNPKVGSGGPARRRPSKVPAGNPERGIPSVESCRCEDRHLSEKKRKADCPRARRHEQTLAPLQEVKSAALKGHRLAQPGRKKATWWVGRGEGALVSQQTRSRRPALLTSGLRGASLEAEPCTATSHNGTFAVPAECFMQRRTLHLLKGELKTWRRLSGQETQCPRAADHWLPRKRSQSTRTVATRATCLWP